MGSISDASEEAEWPLLQQVASAWGILPSFINGMNQEQQASPAILRALLQATGVHATTKKELQRALKEAPKRAALSQAALMHWPADCSRAIGLSISLPGLRSRRNWGFGDTTDLLGYLRWARTAGCDFIGLNPLHAISNRRPFNHSPYLPLSIFYRNHLYLDVESLPEFVASSYAQCLRKLPAMAEHLEQLRAAEHINYEDVDKLKRFFLLLCYRQFRRMAAARAEFAAWRRQQGEELLRFATYCALDRRLHRRDAEVWHWRQWPEQWQQPEAPAVKRYQQTHQQEIEFVMWMQWRMHLQFAAVQEQALALGMKLGLYHDLALATDRFGSDTWCEPELFVEDCRVGSPPDGFSPAGQDWSFPPVHIHRHAQSGFRWFRRAIRAAAAHGGALRMDHVMRLVRLYWIPAGFEASDGAYVYDYAAGLSQTLAEESKAGRFAVVGEDLGTVPPELSEIQQQTGLLSYRLLIFSKQGDGSFTPPQHWPAAALASITTHDLPTLAGYWECADIHARWAAGLLPHSDALASQLGDRYHDKQRLLEAMHREGLLPTDYPRRAADIDHVDRTLQRALLHYLKATPCCMLCINEEDLSLQRPQQNLPGSTWQYPNWQKKSAWLVEELMTNEGAAQAAALLRELQS
jgi:4-alpha-glucanotransferase